MKDRPANDRAYRKTVNAWCMYDWANSAFVCTIAAAVFPPFYRSLVTRAGLSESQATAYWAFTASAALIVISLAAPILGAMADHTGGKKRYTAFFAGWGVLSTAAFVFIGTDTWLLASVLYIGGNIGFAGGNIFYESLLPHLARPHDIDRVSSRGYALGYIGGGILLVINVLWILKPHLFGFPNVDYAIRAVFLSVAVWWGVFSWPFLRHVPEPRAAGGSGAGRGPVREGFSRFIDTLREIGRYRQLLIFLAAFWMYNDGIGTIIKMATAYGDEIGIRTTDMIIALIITQFVGIPFTFLFGALAGRLGARTSVLIALGVYSMISIGAYFMHSAAHFYMLAFAVGMVQGGAQALSRSMFGAMVPKHKSAEFFGFFSTSGKMAGVAGPLIFGLISQAAGSSRISILSVVIFFIAGGLLLLRVDLEEGMREAGSAEKERARTP